MDWKEKLQEERDHFATAEAQACIANQGDYDIIAEIDEIGVTTHDEWYGNLCNCTLSLNQWYNHVAVDNANAKKIERGVMDGTIPLAIVDSGTTFNVRKFGNGLHLTGRLSHKLFKVSTGHKARATKTATMEHKLRKPACKFDMVPGVVLLSLPSLITRPTAESGPGVVLSSLINW